MMDSIDSRPPEPSRYSSPGIVNLEDHLSKPVDVLHPLPYPGLLCQSEAFAVEFPFMPTQKDIDDLLINKGLTQQDKQKYSDIVSRLHQEKKIDININTESSLRDILKFCTASMWMITGDHDEKKAEEILGGSSSHITASQLVDLDNPPTTKCSFFNSAFGYLFEASCKYFRREDLLEQYQLIAVHTRTHQYLGLVSMKDNRYRISAIDPYHTSWKENISTNGINSEELYTKLDQTEKRGSELDKAFWNAINWR